MTAATTLLPTPYWAACCASPVGYAGFEDYRCTGCQRRLGSGDLYLWESSARHANRAGAATGRELPEDPAAPAPGTALAPVRQPSLFELEGAP